ncbi:MAG: hypothetical protein JL50_13290 [Peptococcaceae bacterium BICA1-7]|nr:MAG: hypothetical protein JL50_13290 [Peptococcaceae bacterium BICA1-7]HBV99401.1 hypothetical protein [Desulfotomaculum sp.]
MEEGTLCIHKGMLNTKLKKAGLILIVISWIIYSLILIIPFLPLYLSMKLFLGAVLYLSSHAVFWLGVLILGREVLNKYKDFNLLRRLRRIKYRGE